MLLSYGCSIFHDCMRCNAAEQVATSDFFQIRSKDTSTQGLALTIHCVLSLEPIRKGVKGATAFSATALKGATGQVLMLHR